MRGALTYLIAGIIGAIVGGMFIKSWWKLQIEALVSVDQYELIIYTLVVAIAIVGAVLLFIVAKLGYDPICLALGLVAISGVALLVGAIIGFIVESGLIHFGMVITAVLGILYYLGIHHLADNVYLTYLVLEKNEKETE